MVTRFEPARDLDARVAAKLAFPFVERLATELIGPAQAYAPDAKVWITFRDEKVRPTHVETDGQTVPENLRYKVPSTTGVGTDLGRKPRDPALPFLNRVECRCESIPLPGVIAASINKMPTILQGTRVEGGIETRFPRAAEAHEGTSDDSSVPFFARAISEVAAAHQGARRTR